MFVSGLVYCFLMIIVMNHVRCFNVRYVFCASLYAIAYKIN